MRRFRFIGGAAFMLACFALMGQDTRQQQRDLLEYLIFDGTNGECWVRNSAISGGGEWDSCAAGGGDNVLVNSAATTDPDFQDGDVDFTYAAGVVTATVACSGCIDATDLAADSITPADLNTVAAAGASEDEYCLTYEHSTTEFAWQVCGGGGVSDGDKGDITVSGSGATWTIDADAVTYSKIQDVTATNRLLGRDTAGAGVIEEITVGAALDMVTTFTGAPLYRSGVATWTPTTWSTDVTGNILPGSDNTADLGSAALSWNELYLDGSVTCTGCIDATDLAADSITPADLNTVAAAGASEDEYCLTYEHSTTEFAWQVCGGGGGDSITVNSSAATDPDFLNGDIDWTLTGGNSITATVACSGCIDATDLATNSVAEPEIATGAVGSDEILDNTITEPDLKAVDTPNDNELMTYDTGTAQFEWKSICEMSWPVGSVYISVNSTNPGTSLGCGTWTDIAKGRALVGFDGTRGPFDADEETGGSWDHDHDVTVGDHASHTHTFTTGAASAGATQRGSTASTLTLGAHTHSGTTAGPGAPLTHAAATTGADQVVGGTFGVPIEYIVVRVWKRTA